MTALLCILLSHMRNVGVGCTSFGNDELRAGVFANGDEVSHVRISIVVDLLSHTRSHLSTDKIRNIPPVIRLRRNETRYAAQ